MSEWIVNTVKPEDVPQVVAMLLAAGATFEPIEESA